MERRVDQAAAAQSKSTPAQALMSAKSSISLVSANLLLSALFALMMWQAVPQDSMIIWLAASALISLVELWLRHPSTLVGEPTAAHRRMAFVLDAAVGGLWLYAAVYFFPGAQQNLQFFWLFSLAAPALCTTVYQHANLPACFARIGLAMPVAATKIVSSGESLAIVQAIIVIGIWACLIWLAVRLHRSLQNRATLIANRNTLLKKVADNARDLEALRAKEAESRKEAESANLAKSRFLAHSSHDLRQPLHAISLLLETVDEEALDASTGYVIERVRQSVELLATQFDSLLDLTLLDTGQVEVRTSVIDTERTFTEVSGDLAAVAAANSVQVVVEPSTEHIRADNTIVRRMIQNLLANAIRYTAGGRVTLRTRREGDTAYLDVEDTGQGIAESDQLRIFEEFTKLDTAVTGQPSGSFGLGLAIVNRMARLSGVNVSVQSQLSKGSLFSIGPFPICAGAETPAPANPSPVLDLKNAQVVVIDDDQDTLKATGKLLQKWSVSVTLLTEGDVALMPKPDILICDYELMTDETGIDVIRNVRAQYGVDVPALLISGNTSPDLISRAEEEDLRLLHKPVRPAQLKSAILTLLGTPAFEGSAQRRLNER